MPSFKYLLKYLNNSNSCIWVEVLLIKETQKAILVEFNGKTAAA